MIDQLPGDSGLTKYARSIKHTNTYNAGSMHSRMENVPSYTYLYFRLGQCIYIIHNVLLSPLGKKKSKKLLHSLRAAHSPYNTQELITFKVGDFYRLLRKRTWTYHPKPTAKGDIN